MLYLLLLVGRVGYEGSRSQRAHVLFLRIPALPMGFVTTVLVVLGMRNILKQRAHCPVVSILLAGKCFYHLQPACGGIENGRLLLIPIYTSRVGGIGSLCKLTRR